MKYTCILIAAAFTLACVIEYFTTEHLGRMVIEAIVTMCFLRAYVVLDRQDRSRRLVLQPVPIRHLY